MGSLKKKGCGEKGKRAEKGLPGKTGHVIKGTLLTLLVLSFGTVFWILGMFLELMDYLCTKLGRR